MTELLGNLTLAFALLTSAAAFVAVVAGAKFESPKLLTGARVLVVLFTLLIVGCSATLFGAFLSNDFRIEYVTHYSERALPFGYKLAAFWAGQEGSLLLWALVLAVMSSIAVLARRGVTPGEDAGFIGTLLVVNGFFAALMLFAANPFKLVESVPEDGRGLNPMLQDPNMVAHPPLLFLGYAGFTIPFAMMVGALISGRRDNGWLGDTRRWSIVSWLFLSIGIILGAQWAYLELGWGGYWAWDPVENASLLPWLTGTALLHSIMVQQTRGMFKVWNAGLFALTFILCVFGTYLTRSGIIQSVHAFGESLIGTFFLAFLIVVTLASILLIAVRRASLKTEERLESLAGREALFLATNVLLVLMTAITLIGTIFPIISRLIAKQEVTVGPTFYNGVVAPLGVLLAALMAFGPMLVYGADAGKKLIKSAIAPLVLAGAAIGLAISLGFSDRWSISAIAIVAVASIAIVQEVIKAAILRAKEHNENLIAAFIKLLDSNHRRYGGQVVHVGVIMMIVGIIGSSVFGAKETYTLKPGESTTLRDHKVTFVELKEKRDVNFTAVDATVQVVLPSGKQVTLHPQRRFYDKAEDANSEVAIDSSLKSDVYLMLAGWDNGGAQTAIQVIINPLVSWIWIGGIVLTIGALICLTPKFLPAKQIEFAKKVIPQHSVSSGRRPAGAAM